MNELIIPLGKIEYDDLPLVGGKAAHLCILNAQGFPIPETLVITGLLYDNFISENPAVRESIDELGFRAGFRG